MQSFFRLCGKKPSFSVKTDSLRNCPTMANPHISTLYTNNIFNFIFGGVEKWVRISL